jgi:hypothetical protein
MKPRFRPALELLEQRDLPQVGPVIISPTSPAAGAGSGTALPPTAPVIVQPVGDFQSSPGFSSLC